MIHRHIDRISGWHRVGVDQAAGTPARFVWHLSPHHTIGGVPTQNAVSMSPTHGKFGGRRLRIHGGSHPQSNDKNRSNPFKTTALHRTIEGVHNALGLDRLSIVASDGMS